MDRLLGLQAATDQKPESAIELAPEAGRGDVGAEGLTLALPNGQTLLAGHDVGLRQGRSRR